jgi:hypothetical protein
MIILGQVLTNGILGNCNFRAWPTSCFCATWISKKSTSGELGLRASANGPALSYFLSLMRVRQILRVNTLEVLNASIFEMPDARSDFVDDVIVVCYQQDGPFI